jgi:hypothetical protein
MATWNGHEADNDGRWPDAHAVEVRYPLKSWDPPLGVSRDTRLAALKAERDNWPWLPGQIARQCGPDEWRVTVYVRELALLKDGSPAPEGTPDEDLWFPGCYRDGSEIREAFGEAEAALAEATSAHAADPMPDVIMVPQPEPSAEWLR